MLGRMQTYIDIHLRVHGYAASNSPVQDGEYEIFVFVQNDHEVVPLDHLWERMSHRESHLLNTVRDDLRRGFEVEGDEEAGESVRLDTIQSA